MVSFDAVDDPVEPYLSPRARDPFSPLGAALRTAEAENARLRATLAEAERLADHDGLTGLLNRRGFERELARTLSAYRRYGDPAALIYLDLDGFKGVNDRFGHAVGDQTLKGVAERLLAEVRVSDVVARLGGDEFAVILSHAGQGDAEAKARTLVLAIEASQICAPAAVRLSYGVRAFEPGLEAAQILAEADAAMFVRKGSRRRA